MISKKEEIKRLEEEIEKLSGDNAELKKSIELQQHIHEGETEKYRLALIRDDERETLLTSRIADLERSLEAKEGLAWHKGEPKESGWYLVRWKPMPLADKKTEALHYNPLGRCRWMRGEKGNAERFDGVVYEYAVIV
jgi:hypothetical protein